eukprot:TRINITY_DN4336_c0_g1_i2.p1 TRINITY_DN4336_c0_g1~~TRINITY_DN4336_c0_g1_i2.p1  ORF type:complete len:174 (-),score=25.96 TRINITY_DN4336_c0_g1_i2:33-554(-)
MDTTHHEKCAISIPKIPIPNNFQKITPEALAELLEKNASVLLVDVRGPDYVGGHIPGAVNIPYSEGFEAKCPDLRKDHGNKDNVVFYCMYGQLRSPSAALDYLKSADETEAKKVFVLLDGFNKWMQTFHDSMDGKIEGFDKSQWSDSWEHVHDIVPLSAKQVHSAHSAHSAHK